MRWNERALECQVLSIYVTKVLSVCLSQKMITLPNGLKSSSLVEAISFFKRCNKKMFSMNCRCQLFLSFDFLKNIFLILQIIGEKRKKYGKCDEKARKNSTKKYRKVLKK